VPLRCVYKQLKESIYTTYGWDALTYEYTRRACALRASERYGQYLTQDRHERLTLDPAKVQQAERRDGKFVVHSNDDTLTPADLALGYKQLARVESASRLLKSGRRIRPIFHWAPHRIAAHVSLTMVAPLLERLAANAGHDTWRNIRDDLRQIRLAQFWTPRESSGRSRIRGLRRLTA